MLQSCSCQEDIIIELDSDELTKKLGDVVISFEVDKVDVELNEMQIAMFRGPKGGGYNPIETLDAEIRIDEESGEISAVLTPLQFKSLYDFPNVGSVNKLYVDLSDNAIYVWDAENLRYKNVVEDWRKIETISGGEI